jgi:hypothetical protein
MQFSTGRGHFAGQFWELSDDDRALVLFPELDPCDAVQTASIDDPSLDRQEAELHSLVRQLRVWSPCH